MQERSKKDQSSQQNNISLDPANGTLRFPCDAKGKFSDEWMQCNLQEASLPKKAHIMRDPQQAEAVLNEVCAREGDNCGERKSDYHSQIKSALSFQGNTAFSSGSDLKNSCVVTITGFKSADGVIHSTSGYINGLKSTEDAENYARMVMKHEGYHCHSNNNPPDKVTINYDGKSREVILTVDEKKRYKELWADSRLSLQLRTQAADAQGAGKDGKVISSMLERMPDLFIGECKEDGPDNTAGAIQQIGKIPLGDLKGKTAEELDSMGKQIAMQHITAAVEQDYSSSRIRRFSDMFRGWMR